ncbi:hypothetical protein DVH05_028670 [Phytophthora capsici]|nr:hypothetical protein DVH05_028670 [Phytophthora capsici]
MADVVMTAQESRAVTLNCIVVGIAGQSVGIKIKLNALVDDVKERIVEAYPELKSVGRGKLLLFLAKKADGTWLSADDAFEQVEKRMVTGEVPNEISNVIGNNNNVLNARKTIAKALGNAIPPPEHLHVLVKIIGAAPSTAVSEHKNLVTRKRGAEAMADVEMEDAGMSDAVMEDAVVAAQVNRVRVNCVRCIVVGIGGQSVGIEIESNATVEELKVAIKATLKKRLKDFEPDDLLVFLAKKADGTWLSADDAFKKVKRRMVTGEVPDEIGDIINDDQDLLSGQDTIAEALGSTSLPPKYLHFLVKPPLKRWTIDPKESSAVTEYKRIADLLKESKEVKAVVKTLKDVAEREDPMPFVVLENSSGTGKTQMAFNLEAQGDFGMFYLPCTPSEDLRDEVYQTFKSRQKAFNECITSDIALMKGNGSVSDFRRIADTRRLKVYAFIIAALNGSRTFMGDAFLEDVIVVRKRRSKPIVFFLDEFPRLGKDMAGDDLKARKKLVRSMLNVFRFLRLPLIISATNGTAQNLFTVSGYSRPSSGPVSWCMVIPSLPKFFTAKGSATSVFEWIIQHSRPLFGVLAQKYMDQFPYDDGQDRLEYLTDMIKALTPEFRRLKRTKREIDFEKGQLYLFLGVSYDVDDERSGPSRDTGVEDENQVGMSDDESDEDDISDDEDDESKEYSDEEMPEARCGRVVNSSKEVDLIDGHYGRMEEQENFELELGILGLMKNERKWRCRCVFPRLDADILLFLTMMGDYEGDEDAPQDSAYLRQLGLPKVH